MNNNAQYDRSTNFLELEVNVPRTIGILRDALSVMGYGQKIRLMLEGQELRG